MGIATDTAVRHRPVGSDVRRVARVTGIAGLAYAATFVASLAVIMSGPTFVSPLDDVGAWLVDDAALVRAGSWLGLLALAGLFLPFMTGLGQHLSAAGAWAALLGRLAQGLAVLAVALFAFDAVAAVGLGLDAVSVDRGTLAVAWDRSAVTIVSGFHVMLALGVLAAAAGLHAAGIIRTWLLWLAGGGTLLQLFAGSWVLAGELTEAHDAAAGLGLVATVLVWIPAVSWRLLASSR